MPSPLPAADRLVCAVMAGGSGTRFWPLSRHHEPKQLLKFFGEKSLLRITMDRVAELCPPQRQLCVTAQRLVPAVQADLPDLGSNQIIGEPVARNTAPCMAIAAIVAQQMRPDAILVLLPADHFVADAARFRAALQVAAKQADTGKIVTLGVTPTAPETGYGYIEVGASLSKAEDGLFAVQRFVEKPDLATAQEYLVSGQYLWNAGVFVLRADTALRALDAHVPAVTSAFSEIRLSGLRPGSQAFAAALQVAFERSPSISIDYGVMEHESDISVVRLDAGWSDVGTWQSVVGLKPASSANFLHGPVIAQDCHDSVLISQGPLLAAVGLRHTAVVVTPDATLVLPLERSQDVRQIVAELQKLGRTDLL